MTPELFRNEFAASQRLRGEVETALLPDVLLHDPTQLCEIDVAGGVNRGPVRRRGVRQLGDDGALQVTHDRAGDDVPVSRQREP